MSKEVEVSVPLLIQDHIGHANKVEQVRKALGRKGFFISGPRLIKKAGYRVWKKQGDQGVYDLIAQIYQVASDHNLKVGIKYAGIDQDAGSDPVDPK